ncbi:MAG TPA: metal-dependent hydrolase, partial [Acidiferrobacteraceae bacterium]|nr:metal-dependent hydrolase [Acidiferrobacteraceae bacterium]
MDTLTHGLSAALLARATAGDEPSGPHRLPVRTRMLVALVAAMAPDLDFVIWFFSPQRYLVDHRGWTHSLVLLPLWAALLA